jgi:hypothetical protein
MKPFHQGDSSLKNGLSRRGRIRLDIPVFSPLSVCIRAMVVRTARGV